MLNAIGEHNYRFKNKLGISLKECRQLHISGIIYLNVMCILIINCTHVGLDIASNS